MANASRIKPKTLQAKMTAPSLRYRFSPTNSLALLIRVIMQRKCIASQVSMGMWSSYALVANRYISIGIRIQYGV